MTRMPFVYDDGGRKAAGYKGVTGDCVCRAIAIATGLPYQGVYELLNEAGRQERKSKRRSSKSSAASGVHKPTIRRVMAQLGWTWVPTMFPGKGCTVHLAAGELPKGRLVVAVSRHLTTVVDGVIYDTFDPQRDPQEVFGPRVVNGRNEVLRVTGGRCVYGYFTRETKTRQRFQGVLTWVL